MLVDKGETTWIETIQTFKMRIGKHDRVIIFFRRMERHARRLQFTVNGQPQQYKYRVNISNVYRKIFLLFYYITYAVHKTVANIHI